MHSRVFRPSVLNILKKRVIFGHLTNGWVIETAFDRIGHDNPNLFHSCPDRGFLLPIKTTASANPPRTGHRTREQRRRGVNSSSAALRIGLQAPSRYVLAGHSARLASVRVSAGFPPRASIYTLVAVVIAPIHGAWRQRRRWRLRRQVRGGYPCYDVLRNYLRLVHTVNRHNHFVLLYADVAPISPIAATFLSSY